MSAKWILLHQKVFISRLIIATSKHKKTSIGNFERDFGKKDTFGH